MVIMGGFEQGTHGGGAHSSRVEDNLQVGGNRSWGCKDVRIFTGFQCGGLGSAADYGQSDEMSAASQILCQRSAGSTVGIRGAKWVQNVRRAA